MDSGEYDSLWDLLPGCTLSTIDTAKFQCPVDPSHRLSATVSGGNGRPHFACSQGCSEQQIIDALRELSPELAQMLAQKDAPEGGDSEASKATSAHRGNTSSELASPNGKKNTDSQNPRQDHSQKNVPREAFEIAPRRPSLFEWKYVLYERAKLGTEKLIAAHPDGRELVAAAPLDAFIATVQGCRNDPAVWQTRDFDRSESDIELEVENVAKELAKRYGALVENGNGKRGSAMVIQNGESAIISNNEYLARPEVIERLGYSQSIALLIGGKHHGKTTNQRTLALSVCRGLSIWERKTTPGPVLYVASDDELASTRNELLKMGWCKSDPLMLAHVNPDSDAKIEQVLEDIAESATKLRSTLIILDMLFDFTTIKDELSYAGTREAIGHIQKLADWTKALVVGSHHTPKYLSDFHSAANAALGSQGISARFSPIILTRKWSENLYSVESTTTRDPRGEALKPMKLAVDEKGWVRTAGEFKEWMKWEVYADRVMAIFEGGEQSEGYSVRQIAGELGIDRARAQITLYQLTLSGELIREKNKRSYKYFLAKTDMFARKEGNWGSGDEG